MSSLNTFLFGIYPYVCLAVFGSGVTRCAR